MATSFTVNKADLEFILKQIQVSDLHAGTNGPAMSLTEAIKQVYGLSATDAAVAPFGLRTVDGQDNNLLPNQGEFGAADNPFPRLTDPVFLNDTDGDGIAFGPGGPVVQGNYGQAGDVIDADPRIISNLIVDMSVNNPAAIKAFLDNPLSIAAFEELTGLPATDAEGWLTDPLNEDAANTLIKTIPNQSPDIGLSPGFNAWMTFFGQFFDHGLDLVTKGNNGTVYIPLAADDPLIAGADGVLGNGDDLPAHLRFMALTRATVTLDPNGVPQHENTTTSFVDQNQTYTSHASHQVFLREYALDANGHAVSTGRLLDGKASNGSLDGAIGNWAEVKEQARAMLGIQLTDFDVHNVPLLKTDQYGRFIPGPNGFAQIAVDPDGVINSGDETFVEGVGGAGFLIPANAIRTGHAFLNDIAHHAAPGFVDHDHDPTTAAVKQTADSDPGVGDDGDPLTYDDEMLDAHFVTGDGRGNENIALTTVHSIFHSEHNRLVDANKATILAAAADGDLAFLNEWLVVDVAAVPADLSTLVWDGERLFQAARFVTEMQYQHLVFEEFARRVQPNVDPFIFTNSADIDPSIIAEFAHVVYRFGHSMLTGTVDRLDNDLTTVNGDAEQSTLLNAFLNPQMYIGTGVDLEAVNGAIIRGLTRDVGNEMDEFIVSDVRSNLLGLPLDLAALNIARGRDTGVGPLNEVRKQLYNDFGAPDLKPYTSWIDYAQHIKNPISIVNFIAAYGDHASILAETTTAGKRAAAMELVLGVDQNGDGIVASDRLAFLNATGAYAGGSLGGLNKVDLWIGGLAEELNEFGGMLGSTFNFVFEYQMEHLQNGDRLYYLTRTQGTNLLNQLEPNSFTDLVMRNTDLGGLHSTHLNGALFTTPDMILELDMLVAQEDYNLADLGSKDPVHEDEFLQAIDPRVLRIQGTQRMNGVNPALDAEGNPIYDGGVLKVSGGEHYVLGGTEGNDKLYGDKGIDTLWGDGGNDYLNAGMESDDVFGGEGDDIIEDPFGDDVLRGNQGNDVISAGTGLDLIFGDSGNDYLIVGQDDKEAFAGSGDDFVLGGTGKDFLLGGEGDDWIEGGDGFDTIAGENSELFFNSSIIGHDVGWGQGNDQDYDMESGDDIMISGPGIQRFEGMFGFDWAIAKFDPNGAKFDFQIPIFTNIPTDILKDRFDQVEGGSGWIHDDVLDGDDRGHSGGSSSPDSVPVELFVDHTLDAAGIARIAGLNDLLNGSSTTAVVANFKNGNILLGGDGNDLLRGRGGFDLIDGDAWLNVRIKIDMGSGLTYYAESLNTDTQQVETSVAGKVLNAAGVVQFGGRSLNSLMLDGTINPGQLSILREIKYDDTNLTGASKNVDTAIFQGGDLEYEIEGTRIVYDATTGEAQRRVNSTGSENAPLNIRDVNGDGFITVRDLDDGTVAAPGRVGGLTVSRGALTDDTDQLVNIERLQFADKTLTVGLNAPNSFATGTVTISDPTPFDHDNNPATPGVISPIVGQVLMATLSGFADANGIPLDANGMPVGLTFEWQTTEAGNDGGWATITTGLTYTVRPVDPSHVLRAVAVFKDGAGVTERIASMQTDNVTAPFSVNENSPTGTVVSATIPFSLDYDPLGFGGTGVTDGDVVQLTHVISPTQNAGGRFTIVNVGTAAAPIYQLQVANGGAQMLNYEAGVHTPANQSHQFVDNQYQIVIDTYTDTIANGGVLMASRQFTIFLNDVTGEVANVVPTLDLQGVVTTTSGNYREEFTTASYTGTDSLGATVAWATSWAEAGDNGSATSGEIDINGGQLQFDGNIDGGETLTRAVDLTGRTTATLSFTYTDDDTGAGENIVVEAWDGDSWEQVGTTLGGTTGNGPGTFSAALTSAQIGGHSQIRFRAGGDWEPTGGAGNNGDNFFIDNVNIAFTTITTTPTAPFDYTTSFTEGAAAVAIASSPAVADPNNPTLMGATVKLTNAQAGDLLSIQGTLPAGMTVSFGPAVAGVITMYLSGNGPISRAALQTAVGQVRFSNTGDNPNPTAAATPRIIQVTVNDGEMESVISTATVNVTGVDDPFVATADRIVTNIVNTAFVVPEWVLLANDGDPDSPVVPDITAVTEASSGFTATLIGTGVQITDTDGTGNSFTYTANAGTTANVAVVRDTNDVNGGTGNDILVGDGDGDQFDGGTGNDFVFAGAGNDTIVWNANTTGATDGRDYVDGGNSNINLAATGSIVVTGAGGATANRLNFTENTDGTETITRSVDLTGAASATLSFTWRVDDTEGDDDLIVQAFNGTTWDNIGTLDGGGTEDVDNTFTVNLTAQQIGAHSAIRLVSPNLGGGENFYIDNVNIVTPTGNFRDQFGTQAYNNSNGTRPWTTSWVEANDLAEADTIVISGNGTAEDFKVYARANAVAAGFVDLKTDTEIVITRNGEIIVELDNIEEIEINTAGGTDTVQVIGDLTGTSLNFNTITIDGNTGDDTVDISALSSAHRIVFKSNGGNDTIIGNLRPQDVIELPAGATAADYTTTTNANGVSTMTDGSHSVTFTAPSGMPQVGNDHDDDEDEDEDEDEDDHTAGSDDDDDVNDNENDSCGGDDDGDTDTTGGTGTTAPGAGVVRTGTPQADVLAGTGGDDNIIAFAGDDVATGGAGADAISAGEGADFVNGGDGRDVIFAGAGDDQVFGGGQADVIYGDAGADRIFGDGGNDLINAGAGDDAVFGGAGNDLIVAEIGDGNDVYFGDDSDGGTDTDTLDVSVATADVTVNLGSGPLLNGTAFSSQTGNDTIWGIENVNTGSGNDTIIASNAVNVMNGGSGNDTYRFTSASAADGDTILGFEPGDRVDLTAIDANVGAAGDQSFTLVTGAFTAAGQLAVTLESRADGDFTVIQGNIDGNADADFTVEIAGHQNLTNANLGL